MAGISEDDIKKLRELFEKGIFPAAKDLAQAIENLNDQTKRGIQFETMDLSAKKRIAEEQKVLANRQSNVYRAYTDQVSRMLRQVRDGDLTRAEAQDALNQLRQNTAAVINDDKLRDAFNRQALAAETNAKLIDFTNSEMVKSLVSATKSVAGQLMSAVGSILGAYQSGSSQIGLGAATIEAAASTAGTALQGAGGVATAAGTALTGMRGAAKGAGFALQGIGAAAGLAGSALSATAQKVLPFLRAELEKNIGAFQSLSSSGALFAGGIGEMIRVAGQGGLTLQQLDNVVKANRESLSTLGESVSGGTKRLTSALGAGGDSFRKQMLNLGYTVEEQGALVSETMQAMRQSGGRLMVNDATIIDQTKRYAENLRIVSDITGEDAKKKQALIQQQNMQLAVQQKLTQMGPTQAAAYERAQKNMSELQIRALNEMIASNGQIVTPELAATIGQMPSLQASLNEMYGQVQQGTFDEISARKIQAERGEAIKQEMMTNEGIALAGIAKVGGAAQLISEEMGKELAFRNRFTSDAIAAAEEAAKKQRETQDAQTQAATNVILANQKAMMEIQQAVMDTGVMTAYSNSVTLATTALTDMIKALRAELGTPGNANTNAGRTGEKVGEVVGEVGGAIAGAKLGAMAGVIGGPIGVAAGTVLGGILGSVMGGYVGGKAGGAVGDLVGGSPTGSRQPARALPNTSSEFGPMPEMARGGITNFPVSGAPAMLHGREMVLPLPDSLNKENLENLVFGNNNTSAMMETMRSILGTQSQSVSKVTAIDEEMLIAIQNLNMKFDQMLNTMRDVASSTEATARGVV